MMMTKLFQITKMAEMVGLLLDRFETMTEMEEMLRIKISLQFSNGLS